MCFSFKDISLRSVSLPLFGYEESIAMWSMEEDLGPNVIEFLD